MAWPCGPMSDERRSAIRAKTPHALSPDQERAVVVAVISGEPAKSVARCYGVPYRTLMGILERYDVSPKATDDPERLALRQRWARNQAAMRSRRMGRDAAG